MELNLQQQLYRDSHALTKLQWEIGPLGGQFGCWRSPGATGQGKFDWARRCKSSVCKPGDPFGCSMLKARDYSERTKHLLREWVGAGHYAYAAMFEARGQAGENLRPVHQASQEAMRSLFSGKRWLGRKRRFGISGQITTLTFAKSGQGGWVVRRWLILAVDDSLLDSEKSELAEFLHEMWSRSLPGENAFVKKVEALHPITLEGIPGLAQFVTECISPLDYMPAELKRELEATFGVAGPGEESTGDLAARYRGESEDLMGLFGQFEGKFRLMRADADGLRVSSQVSATSSKSGRKLISRSVDSIKLPERARDFAEYATETFGSAMWKATGAHIEWKQLIEQASKLRTPFMEIPAMPELSRPGLRITKK